MILVRVILIKFPAQSYVCVQSTSEIDEDISYYRHTKLSLLHCYVKRSRTT